MNKQDLYELYKQKNAKDHHVFFEDWLADKLIALYELSPGDFDLVFEVEQSRLKPPAPQQPPAEVDYTSNDPAIYKAYKDDAQRSGSIPLTPERWMAMKPVYRERHHQDALLRLKAMHK